MPKNSFGHKFSWFAVGKITINPAGRYLSLEIPSYYLFFYRDYSLSLDGNQLISGKLWNVFSFMTPLRVRTSIPIRGFKTIHDNYSVELSKKGKKLFLKNKVEWLLSGQFKHVSADQVTRYSWKLRGDLQNIRNKNSTPWELVDLTTKSRRRVSIGSGRRKQRIEKLKRDSRISENGKLIFLGNSKSVDIKKLGNFPKNFDLVAFNRFVSSYSSHNSREKLLISADKKMIRDHGDEMREKASNGLLFISSLLRSGRRGSINIRKEFFEKDIFRSDLSGSIQTFGSSPIFGLQVCLSLSPKTIVFYGVDMSFASEIQTSNSGRGLTNGDGNHFFTNYRDGKDWYRPNWERVLQGFFLFSLIAEKQGVKLFNITPANHVPIRAEHLVDPSGI